MPLADTLKKLRLEAGLTQPELAQKSGVSVGLIRKIEQGKSGEVWHSTIVSLCHGLGVSCEAFNTPPKTKAPRKPPAKSKRKRPKA